MLNQCTIMGYLTRDPELRRTTSGKAVTSLTLACERDYSGPDGDRETDFIDIVTWNNTAEFVSKFFTKGRKAVATGRLQIRNWTDKEGNKRRTAEIVADKVYFADSKKPDILAATDTAPNGYPAPPVTEEDEDSYIPF